MNWGKKIALAYSGFVVFMVGLVYLCIQQKDIFLVTPDYYKEELAYQEKIDGMNNVAALSTELEFNYSDNGIVVKFPEECLESTGQLTLYRPSDAGKDVILPFKLANNTTLPVSTSKLDRGLWKVKLDWTQNGKTYYTEQKLTL
ncbi:FixH family protein [Jiulongibacter sp. NS-SX5]|uniref:FixH family protein n=1 Tax=Jiulongibacter sp. NS-SX5 TaxID=3463854 RepID=UPI004058D25D